MRVDCCQLFHCGWLKKKSPYSVTLTLTWWMEYHKEVALVYVNTETHTCTDELKKDAFTCKQQQTQHTSPLWDWGGKLWRKLWYEREGRRESTWRDELPFMKQEKRLFSRQASVLLPPLFSCHVLFYFSFSPLSFTDRIELCLILHQWPAQFQVFRGR